MNVKIIFLILILHFCSLTNAQIISADSLKNKAKNHFTPFSVTGNMGLSYDAYGLNLNPNGNYYVARRPWNLLRFTLAPTFNFGKLSLPFNFSFTPMQTNFVTPSTLGGFGSIGRSSQNVWQFLTNPLNNFGVAPTYKWGQLQLGTQYLHYSDLSTGDIGLFGYGFALSPGKFRIKFFNGVSQRPINYDASATPPITGAYQRNNWMAQFGMEEEGKYTMNLNLAKGKDLINSVNPAPPAISGILPQEGFTASFVLKTIIAKDYYFNTELAHSIYTSDETQAPSVVGAKDFQPFIKSLTSTKADNAMQASFGRKSKNFDIGVTTKYLGAGFQTVGYPFLQTDRFDYTLNTRFNTWKNKMNVTASVGQRINNLSSTTLQSKQFIGNINWFIQFTDHFNINTNFNNFGFQTSGTSSLKNVANDISINPSYNWSNANMMNLINATYTFSQYTEQLNYFPFTVTQNNTHTALVTYVPTFFKKKFTTDFTLMYFTNKIPLTIAPFSMTTSLYSLTANGSIPTAKNKLIVKGQLMFTHNQTDGSNAGNNVLATVGGDWNITTKLKWNLSMTGNLFKYSNIFIPPNAQYLETTLRTSLMYRFK
ncbi:hypothetical protein GALL_46780 [mine drainage metagenome]|uniref:Uncharacterized protein n=1 Tax=mine drainage metagenome TaxID=410659 RepID=A0A1J5T045_9ZZZZ